MTNNTISYKLTNGDYNSNNFLENVRLADKAHIFLALLLPHLFRFQCEYYLDESFLLFTFLHCGI